MGDGRNAATGRDEASLLDTGPAGVEERVNRGPPTLEGSTPNPQYEHYNSLPQRSHVTLKLFDVLGREVATLVDGEMAAGEHSVLFPGGVYIVQMSAGNVIKRSSIVLLKYSSPREQHCSSARGGAVEHERIAIP
jgi:hypothetical protein